MSTPDANLTTQQTERPTLETARLFLRPFEFSDANEVQKLAGDKDIAQNTMLIPHPYEDGEAERWIGTHPELYESGYGVTFAMVSRYDNSLIGSIGLVFFEQHQTAELGYWIGKPYWNNGYCTEAATRILKYGFDTRKMHRIHAKCYSRNHASGRVMQKIGMQPEGILRAHILKWGVHEDVSLYAILSDEFANT